VTAWTAIIFRTVISNISDFLVSPKGPWLDQESFHYAEDKYVEENSNTKNDSLKLSRKYCIRQYECHSYKHRVYDGSKKNKKCIESRR
jgi:hypothetical protein